jgi:hypothetical protein
MSILRVSNGESAGPGSTGVLLISLYGGILVLGLLARFLWLDSLPGVNGDEAWYGLWVEGLLRDHAWGGKTLTGSFPNPFFLAPLAIVQAIAEPAPWVLRVPALISGLAFIIVGYTGLRSTIGQRPALVFALLAATSPIMIIYSRFGWDASQTPLAEMIFLWACLAGRRIAAVISLCAAILIHPTNIFLVTILVVFWFEYLRSFIEKITGRIGFRSFVGVLLIGGILAAIPISLWIGRAPLKGFFSGGYWHLQHLVMLTLVLIGDQFSGITAYRSIVGDPIGLILHRVIIFAVLIGLSVALFVGARGTQDLRITKLAVGVIAAVILFVIIAGKDGLQTERYALFMIAPVLVLLSAVLARPFNMASTVGLWFAPLLAVTALISVWLNYFEPLRVSGGGLSTATIDGRAARTAAIEPKTQVAQWVMRCVDQHDTVTLWAESYWLAEPLHYYLFYEPKISVKTLRSFEWLPKSIHTYELSEIPNSDAIIVVFDDSDLDRKLQRTGVFAKSTIVDAAGRPFIHIFTKGSISWRC